MDDLAFRYLNAEAFKQRVADGAKLEDIFREADGIVATCDAEPVLAKQEDVGKDVTVSARDVRIVYSSDTVDRDGDIIRQKGIKLKNYRRNPVVGYGHFGGIAAPLEVRAPIGKSVSLMTSEDGSKSVSVDRFVDADMPVVGPLAEMTFRMLTHRERYLRAASIGFRPIKYTRVDEDKDPDRNREYFVPLDYDEIEKLEHSIVPVPANPEALTGAKQAGIDIGPLKAWAEAALEADPDTLVLSRKHLEDAYRLANGNAKLFYINLRGTEGDDFLTKFVTSSAASPNGKGDETVIDTEKLAEAIVKGLKERKDDPPPQGTGEGSKDPVAELKASVDKLNTTLETALKRAEEGKGAGGDEGTNGGEQKLGDEEALKQISEGAAQVVKDALAEITGQLPN